VAEQIPLEEITVGSYWWSHISSQMAKVIGVIPATGYKNPKAKVFVIGYFTNSYCFGPLPSTWANVNWGERFRRPTAEEFDRYVPVEMPDLALQNSSPKANEGLVWSQDRPTAPGYYWLKELAARPFIVEVENVRGGGVEVWYMGNESSYPIATVNGEWAGPIEVSEPEEGGRCPGNS